jgi:acyl carrier protein
MSDAGFDRVGAADRTPDTDAMVRLVQVTLADLRAGAAGLPPVTADSVLDRDLGLDSLARMELLMRAERSFGVDLPEDALQRVETVRDLLHAVRAGPAAASPALGPPAADASVLRPPVPNERPAAARTLQAVLQWRLEQHADQTQIVVLHDEAEQRISVAELARAAAAVAAGLQRAGVAPRDCVAIMLPTSADYFASYFGVLLASAIPVPIYPPARVSQLEDHVRRHAGILANAQATALITVPEAMVVARLLQAQVPGLRHVLAAHDLRACEAAPHPVHAQPDDIAFIQYTSGSTGNPKGVALTHANLLANIDAMARACQATSRDVFVSWLPLYHDMGLIGAWLSGLVVGFPLVVMSPLAFLSRPRRWLDAITRYRGTLSAGPNFAYELCLKRIGDDELDGLDLASWRLAFNGAEAVSPDTVRRFTERFAPCGLRAEAMAPVYGLAECAVGLLFPPLGRAPPIDAVDRDALMRGQRAQPAAAGDAAALRFVGCGQPIPGHAVRIVDAAGAEVGERLEGRLEFKGPSATRGYYRNPEQTARLRRGDWLDSGDRAYRVGGEFYITGRVKDIVIRAGRNLYPDEIEEAVGRVPGIRKGCVAVFGMPDPAAGTERLVVLAEARDEKSIGDAALRDAVARAVGDTIGEPADEIVLARAHTVLKTSSGKVRRAACRELLASGGVGQAPRTAWRQMLRLALDAAGLRARAFGRSVGNGAWALWAGVAVAALALPTWLLSIFARRPEAAWHISHRAARWLLRCTRTPFDVRGLEHLPAGPCVLVANHASYLDGLALVAALPRPFAFVAKRELEPQFIAGRYLRSLGAVFVERADVVRSVRDAERLAALAQQGQSLAVFPEGTFVAQPGLRPFHLGAFLAAARAAVPVVPVTLRGTRQMLSANRRWPRRTPLAVEIGPPIDVPASEQDLFACAVRLREASRQDIAAHMSSP